MFDNSWGKIEQISTAFDVKRKIPFSYKGEKRRSYRRRETSTHTKRAWGSIHEPLLEINNGLNAQPTHREGNSGTRVLYRGKGGNINERAKGNLVTRSNFPQVPTNTPTHYQHTGQLGKDKATRCFENRHRWLSITHGFCSNHPLSASMIHSMRDSQYSRSHPY